MKIIKHRNVILFSEIYFGEEYVIMDDPTAYENLQENNPDVCPIHVMSAQAAFETRDVR